MTSAEIKALVETSSDCAARKAVAGFTGNRQAPASNGWLRDNAKMIGVVLAVTIAGGGAVTAWLLPRSEHEAHVTSLTPHPQKEAVEALMRQHHSQRMSRLESENKRTQKMIVQSTAPSRRATVQAIADDEGE